ncbi:MAG: DUF3575 domain-containing protein [Limnohabitans sp.]|nr:DUF3575 domain-containing protein [Limnohabitans sp.]
MNYTIKNNPLQKIKLLFLVLIAQNVCSQTSVKANVTTILGFPQIGIETALGKKTSFQIDAFASLWKSFNEAPFEVYMVFPEFRYYPKKTMDGFFVGGHIGGSAYNFQKWNYINTDFYQKGYSIMYGVTIGYQIHINDRFALEAFLGGGHQEGFYKGYRLSDGSRYETADNFNKSGEWLPYRGGIMVVYKLGKKKNEE